jgi:hypothetical protein
MGSSLAAFIVFVVSAIASADQTVTLTAIADSFVREQDPTSNFGGAGLLCTAGENSVNHLAEPRGRFDSVLRFDSSVAVASFDATYGADQWSITHVALQVTEIAAPGNTLFPRGVGEFGISWLSDDSWLEGAGTPISPSHGPGEITWDLLQTILMTAVSTPLGTGSNVGADGIRQYALSLECAFIADVMDGGLVGLHVSPQTATLGFSFYSRNFGIVAWRPQLIVTAAPILKGDMNCDGVVDPFDIEPFVTVLVDPTAYVPDCAICNAERADLNQDGDMDGEDVQGFAAALLSP